MIDRKDRLAVDGKTRRDYRIRIDQTFAPLSGIAPIAHECITFREICRRARITPITLPREYISQLDGTRAPIAERAPSATRRALSRPRSVIVEGRTRARGCVTGGGAQYKKGTAG